jgi:hypothetical protein
MVAYLYLYSIQVTSPSPTQQIGLLVIASNSPIPSGVVAYVPIYISNPSNAMASAVVSINISKSKYSAYLSNQSNFEFYYELPSPESLSKYYYFEMLNYTVVESNSSAIIRTIVQLPSAIAPNSEMTIYMGFKSD